MLNTRYFGAVAALTVILPLCVDVDTEAHAQQPPDQQARGAGQADRLALAWAAIAAGRPADAAVIADALLDDVWYGHAAIVLGIAAGDSRGGALAALDTYERWLQTGRPDDPFLLRPIAASTLAALSTSQEPRVRFTALAALARAGDAPSRKALVDAAQQPGAPVEANAALAEVGERSALVRLAADIAAGGPRDKTPAIRALRSADGPGASAAIAKGLQDPAPPSRIAAANALAELGAKDQIAALQAAAGDPDPAVRFMVSAALARLGDPAAGVSLEALAGSPLGDIRLFAAEADADRNPGGNWSSVARGMLNDPDPLLRLQAAELLLRRGPDPGALAVVTAALADPNPAVRSVAAKTLAAAAGKGGVELALLRRLLRDELVDVRMGSARALLALSEAKPR